MYTSKDSNIQDIMVNDYNDKMVREIINSISEDDQYRFRILIVYLGEKICEQTSWRSYLGGYF